MVLEDVNRDAAHEVTPMSEIRRCKGMPLEEYAELYPVWADWMRNQSQLMYDANGGAWVPRWNPELEWGSAGRTTRSSLWTWLKG